MSFNGQQFPVPPQQGQPMYSQQLPSMQPNGQQPPPMMQGQPPGYFSQGQAGFPHSGSAAPPQEFQPPFQPGSTALYQRTSSSASSLASMNYNNGSGVSGMQQQQQQPAQQPLQQPYPTGPMNSASAYPVQPPAYQTPGSMVPYQPQQPFPQAAPPPSSYPGPTGYTGVLSGPTTGMEVVAPPAPTHNPNLPPGTTVITNRMYRADSSSTQQYMSMGGAPQQQQPMAASGYAVQQQQQQQQMQYLQHQQQQQQSQQYMASAHSSSSSINHQMQQAVSAQNQIAHYQQHSQQQQQYGMMRTGSNPMLVAPPAQQQQQHYQPSMQTAYAQPNYAAQSTPYEVIEPPEPQRAAPPPPVYQATSPVVQPATTTTTNILSHADSSLLLQEAFLVAGAGQNLFGQVNPLDLQGIWARVKGKQGEEMRLALRMVNQDPQRQTITGLQFKFEPNSFGLVPDPSVPLLPGSGSLSPGQTHTSNLVLFCSPENQRITNPNEELTAVIISVAFNISNGGQFDFKVKTDIPLHIFFMDHPQNPSAAHESLLPISSSAEGPRLTQSAFLDIYQGSDPAASGRQFAVVSGIPWKRWYSSAASSGLLTMINGQLTEADANFPSPREVSKVVEHKLSTNRVYVVAAREPTSTGSIPDLVFFISFKVGDGLSDKGTLVVGEIRFFANPGDGTNVWERCDVVLKSKINGRLWPGVERALKAILLS